jgi:hypothetical protein
VKLIRKEFELIFESKIENYYGNLCELASNTACNSSPCFNGGQCQNFGSNAYVCVCLNGWTGLRCESRNFKI